MKGDRLPSLAKIAAAAAFSQVTVTRYGKTETIAVHAFTCLWYSVAGTAPVTVILIRDKSKTGYDLALVTTEKDPDIARVIERYAARWAIEVAIEDAKQLFGTGQARNRTAAARRAHHPVHARLPGNRRLLVRHRRPPPCRRRGPPAGRPLVHGEDRAVHRRHDRQAPPRHHRRQI